MATSASAIQWDTAALNRLLEQSPTLRAHLAQLGDAGVQFAPSVAPDAPPLRQGYIDSFVWTIGHDRTGLPVLCIANTDWKTWFIENGTAPHQTHASGPAISTPAHHVLDRTLDHLRS